MKSLNDIKKEIQQFNVTPSAEMRQKVLNPALNLHNRQRISGAERWRQIMKSKTTRYAAAAIITVAVLIGLNVFTATPAWALDQTIEALRDITGIYFCGTTNYSGRPQESFKIWVRPNSMDASISGDFKLLEGDNHISVASEKQNMTYVYTQDPGRDVVYITKGLNRHCQPFPTSNLFRQLKDGAKNWKERYGKDPETGRDSVFVTCEGFAVNTARYWQFEFDLETKYPVRASVWFTSDYSGQPHFDFTTITYNPDMPDDLFAFKIPPDAQVVDCDRIRQLIDEGPGCGIDVSNLSIEDACRKTAQAYWQAVAEKNVQAIQHIRPLAVGGQWEQLSALYEKDRPILPVTVSGMNHLNDPGTFAEVTCSVTTEAGKTLESVLNIDIRETDRGEIAVVTGVVGPELSLTK